MLLLLLLLLFGDCIIDPKRGVKICPGSQMTWLKVADDAPTAFLYSPFNPSLFAMTGACWSRVCLQPIL